MDWRHDKAKLPFAAGASASNGKRIYGKRSVSEALIPFSCHRKLNVDSLLPVFAPANNRVFEHVFHSTQDIDDFMEILPVREMYFLHTAYAKSPNNNNHNYVWMMRWLQTCMELSEISRKMIHDRLQFLENFLVEKGELLDAKIERDLQMQSDGVTDSKAIEWAKKGGMILEESFNDIQNLWAAMNEIDILADKLRFGEAKMTCLCGMCDYYRSPLWKQEQPATLAYDTLLPRKTYQLVKNWQRAESSYLLVERGRFRDL